MSCARHTLPLLINITSTYTCLSVPLVQEFQRGPCDGARDGAPLRLRPDVHHGEDHLRVLPPEAGGAEIPSEPEGGGGHAEVQTPGQIPGEGTGAVSVWFVTSLLRGLRFTQLQMLVAQ